MCNFYLASLGGIEGWTWGTFNINFFEGFTEGVFVFIANDNDVLFSVSRLFFESFDDGFYKANSWYAGEKVSLR